VVLGIARELLCEGYELVPGRLARRLNAPAFLHSRIILPHPVSWQPQRRPYNRSVKRAAIIVAVLLAFVAGLALTPPRGPRSMRRFDPVRLADLELRMWQAYYGKQNVRLFALLVTMLHEQYRYSWATAGLEGFHLARAAARFAELHGSYEVVLPDLEAAYRRARTWTGASFDERAVARAELAWWVARRTPGENNAEHVGDLIAQEYALLYETTPPVVNAAAQLRAQAAAIRDAEADRPDWSRIGRLLRQSYSELFAALSTASV
jgi:hypothetical protein